MKQKNEIVVIGGAGEEIHPSVIRMQVEGHPGRPYRSEQWPSEWAIKTVEEQEAAGQAVLAAQHYLAFPMRAQRDALAEALRAIQVGTSPESVALQYSNCEALCSELNSIARAALAQVEGGTNE